MNKDRGIELLQEAVTTLRTEGSRELTIETLEFLRDNIKDDYKERRRVMGNYDSDTRYLNIGGKNLLEIISVY